jgi:hypothetical protein
LVGLYVRRLLWEENPDQMFKGIDLISKYLDVGSSGKEVIEAFVDYGKWVSGGFDHKD